MANQVWFRKFFSKPTLYILADWLRLAVRKWKSSSATLCMHTDHQKLLYPLYCTFCDRDNYFGTIIVIYFYAFLHLLHVQILPSTFVDLMVCLCSSVKLTCMLHLLSLVVHCTGRKMLVHTCILKQT